MNTGSSLPDYQGVPARTGPGRVLCRRESGVGRRIESGDQLPFGLRMTYGTVVAGTRSKKPGCSNMFAGAPSGESQAGQNPLEWITVGPVVVLVQGTLRAWRVSSGMLKTRIAPSGCRVN